MVAEFRTEIDAAIKSLIVPVDRELVDRLTAIRDRAYKGPVTVA